MEITFLGTGAAEGVPAINCKCEHCTRALNEQGKLVRQRNAILFSLPNYELLVDAPPGIRTMISHYNITHLSGVLATRSRYDHIGGIREFEYWLGELDFLAEERLFEMIKGEHWTEKLDRLMFHIPYYPGASLYFSGFSIIPFAARGPQPIFGISIKEDSKRVIYTSDTPTQLTNYARSAMQGCDVLIVNTPTFDMVQANHINSQEAIKLAEQVRAERLILTYISHRNKPHDELEEHISHLNGVSVAFDGMKIEV